MTESSLLLLTTQYPFASGEEFIEAEIDALAARFSEVLIAPLSYRPGMLQTRELPANARVILPPAARRSGSPAKDLLRFAARRPQRGARSIARAVRSQGGLRRFAANLRFDLLASALADGIAETLPSDFGRARPAVIYSYWFHTQARVAVELAERLALPTVPLVSRGHRGDIYLEENPTGFLPQRDLILDRLDRLEVVSAHGADALRKRYPRYADRIFVSRLGVAPATNPGNPELGARLLVSCSWVKPVKRLDLLVDAIDAAQRSDPGIRWIHFGSGSAAAMAALRARAESRLSPGSFDFAGAVGNAELRARYAELGASAFVNVSSSEGVPVSIMEALAQGMPIIATDVGGTAELISPETGMFDGLLPADPDADAIASRILTLLGSEPGTFAGFVDASLAHWEREWSSERNYREFSEMLAALAADGRDARTGASA